MNTEEAEAEESDLEVHSEEDQQNELSSDDEADLAPKTSAYNTLLQSFQQSNGERKPKRRKIETEEEASISYEEAQLEDVDEHMAEGEADEEELDEEPVNSVNGIVQAASDDDDEDPSDPYDVHFARVDANELARRLKAIEANEWRSEKQVAKGVGDLTLSVAGAEASTAVFNPTIRSISDWPLKEKLVRTSEKSISAFDNLQKSIATLVSNYVDLLAGNRTPENAASFRQIACLHALNHVLKGRDRILKNNGRLSRANESPDLDIRDQGFTRPKVLMLVETRQMASSYAETITSLFDPEQQENKQRFKDSFTAPLDERDYMPEDYLELFSGNNDNNFLTGLKFTRKTLKYFAAFYSSDIILASPLGLKRIIEHDDVKKRDHDFLSSIELCIVDQADAMQMQNWSHVELVFSHLNLQVRDAHGCDFNRVRSVYLDGHAANFRQTLIFSAFITPEMNRLYNTSLQNISGKAKLTPISTGDIITSTAGLGIKQTFSRFLSPSPAADPDARFKYFTTAILPSLLRLPKPTDGCRGILVFIPSYFDFLRVRNTFATSTLTENISFGAIHDYTETSDQRRARAHFLSGRHAILLYTQRAHHFFRLKIRGVKRVVLYGLPDNGTFYSELVAGYIGTTLTEGRVSPEESGMRAMFSRFEGLRLERIVGGDRVKGMLGGTGDTFDFV